MDRASYVNDLHTRFGVAHPALVDLVGNVTGEKVAAVGQQISAGNEVHEVHLAEGSAVYLRIAYPGTPESTFHREAWVMSRARDAGVPVPEVVAVRSVQTDDGARAVMVLREADGHQLSQVLPALSPAQRSAVMADVGRVLGIVASVPLPGARVPDEDGTWADPDAHQRRYLANVLDDCQHLPAAGLTPAEVDQVVEVLQSVAEIPVEVPLVLCHGDLSPDHVFVDPRLRVVGLIDWGEWYAGSAVSELAGLAMRVTKADFDVIVAGHGGTLPTGPALRRQLAWHAIAQATGEIRWLVTSGQTGELEARATPVRNALAAWRCD